ncbi:MAG: DUF2318 domain-containing protein [Deltaproteobacteria bacterium]|jgi:uncharacterized membrane protein|nr:DUF2318 domain-containing protein [Deltaproteobacteria bacterium]
MLLYLINVADNSWAMAVAAPIILHLLGMAGSRKSLRRLAQAAMALGLLSSAVLATLRLNTGWVIREYYDLGVLVPLLASILIFLAISAVAAPCSCPAANRAGHAVPEPPLGPFRLAFARAFIALVLATGLSILWLRLFGLRVLIGLPASLVALLPALFLGPPKESRLRGALVASGLASLALLTARVGPNLTLYPFEFGVGMDSVFNLDYMAKVAGYLSGLATMALVWLAIRFLARQAPPRLLRWFLFLGLLVILAQLSLETFQILAGRRMLPKFLFSLVLWLLERKGVFLFAQAAVWSALAIALIVSSRLTEPTGSNPALRRRMRARLRDDLRAGVFLLASMALVAVTSTALRAVNSRGPVIAEPDPVAIEDGLIRLGLASVSDGNLHRRVYQAQDGTPVRFIVVKKSQSAYGVGLDACDICGQSGYYQRGDQIICKLCDVVMNKSTIGFPGGCNPVPLSFSLGDGALLIDPGDLEAEAHRFK